MNAARRTPAPGRIERRALDASRDAVLARMLEEERVQSRLWDATLLRRLARYLKPHLGLAAICVGLAVAEAIMMTLPGYTVGLAVDRIVGVPRPAHLLDAVAGPMGRWLAAHVGVLKGTPAGVRRYSICLPSGESRTPNSFQAGVRVRFRRFEPSGRATNRS